MGKSQAYSQNQVDLFHLMITAFVSLPFVSFLFNKLGRCSSFSVSCVFCFWVRVYCLSKHSFPQHRARFLPLLNVSPQKGQAICQSATAAPWRFCQTLSSNEIVIRNRQTAGKAKWLSAAAYAVECAQVYPWVLVKKKTQMVSKMIIFMIVFTR